MLPRLVFIPLLRFTFSIADSLDARGQRITNESIAQDNGWQSSQRTETAQQAGGEQHGHSTATGHDRRSGRHRCATAVEQSKQAGFRRATAAQPAIVNDTAECRRKQQANFSVHHPIDWWSCKCDVLDSQFSTDRTDLVYEGKNVRFTERPSRRSSFSPDHQEYFGHPGTAATGRVRSEGGHQLRQRSVPQATEVTPFSAADHPSTERCTVGVVIDISSAHSNERGSTRLRRRVRAAGQTNNRTQHATRATLIVEESSETNGYRSLRNRTSEFHALSVSKSEVRFPAENDSVIAI